MDRLAQLIGKLKEQFEQNADRSELLATTQLIQQQLFQNASPTPKVNGTSKVSVVLPSMRRTAEVPLASLHEEPVEETVDAAPVETMEREAPIEKKEKLANGKN